MSTCVRLSRTASIDRNGERNTSMPELYLPKSPSPSKAGYRLNRRSMLKGIAGVAGAASLPALLAACGDDDDATTDAGNDGGESGGESSGSGIELGAASGEVTIGSNYSNELPQAGSGRRVAASRTPTITGASTRSTTTRSRRTSPPTSRTRMTSSRGSPVSACGSSPTRVCSATSPTSGTPASTTARRGLQDRLDRRRRQAVLRAVDATTSGASTTARACSRRTATPSRPPRTS